MPLMVNTSLSRVREASASRSAADFIEGFTLLEILVVVVIISVITTVTLFSVDVTGHQKARTFVKEIRFLMNNLSSEAILSGNPHGLQWERRSQKAVPVVYKGNGWSTASRMKSVGWRGFAKVSLFIDGVSLEEAEEEEKDVSADIRVVGMRRPKEKRRNPPEILFWSTGLWEPAGEIKIEIDSLPYADIIWTASGRTTIRYPDEDDY